MKTRAAVAFAAGKPLEILDVDLEGPKVGEVLVKAKATGVFHTYEFTLSGADPDGLFLRSSAMRVRTLSSMWGPGVTSVKMGDHVIPFNAPKCCQCSSCPSRKRTSARRSAPRRGRAATRRLYKKGQSRWPSRLKHRLQLAAAQ